MLRHSIPVSLLCASLCLAVVRAQATSAAAFEVATVKPAAPNNRTRINFLPGGRFTAISMTLKALLSVAYDVREFQIAGGPSWMTADRYDITAKAENSSATTRDMVPMLQTLLTQRFKLALHWDTKELPVYELIVDNGGLKLKASDAAEERSLDGGNGRAKGTKVDMPTLSQFLSMQLRRTVIDRTGATGAYDVALTWVPETASNVPFRSGDLTSPDNPRAADAGPSLFTAVQEQLGLKLVSRRGPVQSIVIDRAERPTE